MTNTIQGDVQDSNGKHLQNLRQWCLDNKKSILIHIILLISQLVNGIHIICMRFAVKHVHPLSVAGFRILIAAPLLFLFAYGPKGGENRALPNTKKLWFQLAILGLFGVTLNQLLVVVAMQWTTATIASILLPTIPVFTTLLGILAKREKFTWMKALAVLLSFLGVMIMVGFDRLTALTESALLLGNILLLSNNFAFSIYLVLQKIVLQTFPYPLALTSWVSLLGGVVILMISSSFMIHVFQEQHPTVPLLAWLAIGYNGLFGSAIGYVVNSWVVKNSSVSLVSMYVCAQPMTGSILAYLILGETMEWSDGLGAPFIIAGLLLVAREQQKLLKDQQEQSLQLANKKDVKYVELSSNENDHHDDDDDDKDHRSGQLSIEFIEQDNSLVVEEEEEESESTTPSYGDHRR